MPFCPDIAWLLPLALASESELDLVARPAEGEIHFVLLGEPGLFDGDPGPLELG